MRICLVNSFYPPYIGGAERYVSSLAHEFAGTGHDVTVFCADRPLAPGETYDGKVRVVRMKTPLMLYGTPITIFPPSVLYEKFDVIHANFPSPYLAAGSSLASRITGIPSVLTWHNDLPIITTPAGVLIRLHDVLSRSYVPAFRRIIATTKVYALSSKTLRRYSSKVSVIPNGVDTKKFSPTISGDAIRDKYDLAGKKIALFVGALSTWHRYKGVDVLMKAFAIASRARAELRLLVVGGGNMRPSYRNLAQELRLEDKVTFAGQVDDDELPKYYAASDFVVLPSKDSSEGFGLVLLEAMASGKAVISSTVGGVVEVVKNGVTGLTIKPNEAEALARAIIDLCDNEEERLLMGAAGRKIAQIHDWSLVARNISSLYSELQ